MKIHLTINKVHLILRKQMSPKERFMLRVRKSGQCWIWGGGPMFWDGKNSSHPSRFSYRTFVGNPGKSKIHRICPRMDCVAPRHLRLGPVTGENHGRSRLSDVDVKKIRALYQWWGSKGGATQKRLAQKFKTSVSNINKILHRKTRK